MKTLKVLSVTALAGLSIAALASCGGNNDSKKIVFYNSAGSTIASNINTVIESFEEKYPGWTVEVVKQSNYDATLSQIVYDVQSQDQPSLAFCYPDHVASYITTQDLVIDLNNYISSTDTVKDGAGNDVSVGYTAEELADFEPSFMEEGRGSKFYKISDYGYSNDSLLCIPFMKSTEVMYVNMDQLKAAGIESIPTTWEEMWAATAKLKQQNPGDGYYPLCYDSEDNWAINMCMQNGWDYTTNEGENHFLFNNDNVKNWFNTIKTKFDAGEVLTKNTFSQDGTKYTSDLFKQNGCTFCIGSSAGAQYQDPQGAFKWAVAPIPGSTTANGVNSSVVSQGPSLVMFNQGNSEKATMTWMFIKELVNPVNQASLSMATGYNSVRLSSYEIDEYQTFLNNSENIKGVTAGVARSLSANFYTSAVFVGSSLARTQLGTALVYTITGKKTAEAALNDAYRNSGGK